MLYEVITDVAALEAQIRIRLAARIAVVAELVAITEQDVVAGGVVDGNRDVRPAVGQVLAPKAVQVVLAAVTIGGQAGLRAELKALVIILQDA